MMELAAFMKKNLSRHRFSGPHVPQGRRPGELVYRGVQSSQRVPSESVCDGLGHFWIGLWTWVDEQKKRSDATGQLVTMLNEV